MRNNEKNINNGMIQWRHENDEMEDDGRIVKNEEIRKSRNRLMLRDQM